MQSKECEIVASAKKHAEKEKNGVYDHEFWYPYLVGRPQRVYEDYELYDRKNLYKAIADMLDEAEQPREGSY